MSKIVKKMKIMQPGGTLSDYVLIGAEAENINVDGESVETKLGKKPYYYDTVADMKTDTKLKAGDMAVTLGYYSVNDGGAAKYKIREKTSNDIIDNKTLIELNNGLVAEFIPEKDIINVKQFGFKEDDTETNITNFINAIFQLNYNYLFKNLTFSINNDLIVKSNTIIRLENTFITNTTSTNQKSIFKLSNVSNVSIIGKNSSLNFNKPNVVQQACVWIINSKNIKIENLSLTMAGGDGIIMQGTTSNRSENVEVNNCIIDNNRRNGISLIGGIYNIRILNCKIINTSDNSQGQPQLGIDFEPWQNTIYNEFITVENCIFENNTGGAIGLFFNNKDIHIKNSQFNSNAIQFHHFISNGEEHYCKNVNIKNNMFNSTNLYIQGTIYSNINVINNNFYKTRILCDPESDHVVQNLPLNSVLNIKNNLFIDYAGYAIQLNNAYNVNVINNTFNNIGRGIVNMIQSKGINIDNNFINKYAMRENVENTDYCVYGQNSSYITVNNNNFIGDETRATYISNLIYMNINCNKIKITNNIARIGNYNQFNYNDTTDVISYNNISKTIANQTQRYAPSASEFYVGTIINVWSTDHYVPYICIYDTTSQTYKWKQFTVQ